ncbi:MAG TPA: UDP-N-acetylmuramoyl-L-alanyl-D-glutamate--2,6-diaminopimelate ligase [Candidatus Ratteibacteria bacterium]|jgi:UDP-N-acetylmuramoyl-L-alanyl-D-glutamate--2,6-diaminopimelate ligase|uniref:UDP-N-acetylmuramoyl-L-alanyl-D-glutamate--2,6-diaminopimelate ligase n=1 Tax=candidate division TA06 bacterium ADurb.Bin131 TaxID=1852827 RepID=A0A1V6C6J2_UNCT6|nr:MAG: UDP-N-acetylmuramoyl-L-alanyl-D-glutamate--2,6-diaminopimelate ligase [candidate division TA06 bacterium ADurb.Bin131]HOC02505.1 UDP-N-acetylmuramoyl-L-alanyl-D-glutamate--2,6-diaminopimelate ligase [bacterium]HRS06659.1 UDP-N-acetylmuramoyl-L-alanyl-D-glutamate--2,6-diaminopimelate ligase [Candidatus Ratteibacteria bacterium]HON06317.1 UDP-N-acetylmuramoyl-L-alanyl-D-glutamate--2,6-diaminopimelate ligase [bacterium]HPC29386.1 UDP-N-acetylmuramoyl-L-alanyl-D-glutamate--2,6-diaminopimela
MKVKELIKNTKVVKSQEILNREVSGIFYDSRKVLPGGIFVAIHGTSADGNAFVQEAIERGASVVVTEKRDLVLPSGVGLIVVENSRKFLAEIADIYYHSPSKNLKIVGVTGTKGKTSTAMILKEIFEAASFKTGLIGTIQYEVGQRIVPSTNTTPESIDIQALLAEMVRAGLTHAILEVSSHSIDQGRIECISFDAGIFTNIASHEHLDYHKNFRNYLESKLKFFSTYLPASKKKDKIAVINIDDVYSRIFINTAREKKLNVVTYGLSRKAEFKAENFTFDRNGTSFVLRGKKFSTKLLGSGNLYNCLAAISTAVSSGISIDTAVSVLGNIKNIPGRMEFIDTGRPFTVVVDYAHTHRALEELLKTVRHLNPGRILLVFGCGGDRDRSKRPIMGKIAARFADRVYITSDNPRNENPNQIISDIYRGIPFWYKRKCELIPDRRSAIKSALSCARENDWVVIAGKGHEQYQIIKNIFYQFDDRKVVLELLKEINN